jgi:ATP-dependent protease ClpP protease subunit|tara:strand:- start:9450 stop:10088 length:639 start_codon:yes stop_codon:yes gene_type:complete
MSKDVWMAIKDPESTPESSAAADNKATHSDSKNRIESINNDIYFYAEVRRQNNLTLNKKLDSLGIKYFNYSNSLGMAEVAPINLYINSYGGSVFAGFSSVDHIINCKVPVHSIVDGCAASAATIMSVVADHRMMQKHSFMLIHQLSAGSWGKFEDLKDDMTNNELLMKTIKEIYEQYTKIPRKQLNEILKRDLWWDAKTCLEYGLVDEIIGD